VITSNNDQSAPEGSPEMTLTFNIPGAGQRPADFTVKEGVIVFVGKKKGA
jgi:hypothetical protein